MERRKKEDKSLSTETILIALAKKLFDILWNSTMLIRVFSRKVKLIRRNRKQRSGTETPKL